MTTTVTMNQAMRCYSMDVANLELPPTMLAMEQVRELFASMPINTGDDTLVLPWTPNWRTIPRDQLVDLTGYECFVNHIHLDSVFAQGPNAPRLRLRLGLVLGEHLADRLRDYGLVTVIVSCDGEDTVLRVHRTRPGEQWLSDDIEAYDEGVLAITTSVPQR